MSFYSRYSEISRSPSVSSTPSSQSFASNTRKRESWCDQSLKQSFLENISEVEEYSSPQSSRYSSSHQRSGHAFQRENETPLYFLPHVKSHLKFDVSIPEKSVPLGLFYIEKTPTEKISQHSDNLKKPQGAHNTPKFNLNFIENEKLRTPSPLNNLADSKLGFSFFKTIFHNKLVSGSCTNSNKLLENSKLSSLKLISRLESRTNFSSISNKDKKKIDFEDIDIKTNTPKTTTIQSKIKPIKWDFPTIISTDKVLKSCSEIPNSPKTEIKNESIEIQRKKLESISKFYDEFLDDIEEVKTLISDFNEESKKSIELQKSQKKEEKIKAEQVKKLKLTALKTKASEIPNEIRWIRHKILYEGEDKVEIWNHVATRSSQYSGNLIYEKFLVNGKNELRVHKGFSNDRSEKIWENFSVYLMNLALSKDNSETLFNISKYWLLFLKFERRVARIAEITDEFLVRVDSFNVFLSGLLLSMPWEMTFNFAQFSQRYDLADMILEYVTK